MNPLLLLLGAGVLGVAVLKKKAATPAKSKPSAAVKPSPSAARFRLVMWADSPMGLPNKTFENALLQKGLRVAVLRTADLQGAGFYEQAFPGSLFVTDKEPTVVVLMPLPNYSTSQYVDRLEGLQRIATQALLHGQGREGLVHILIGTDGGFHSSSGNKLEHEAPTDSFVFDAGNPWTQATVDNIAAALAA